MTPYVILHSKGCVAWKRFSYANITMFVEAFDFSWDKGFELYAFAPATPILLDY